MQEKLSILTITYGLWLILCSSTFASPIVSNPGDYKITVETIMPNLEENLRYATVHDQKCLNTQDVTTLFPILQHKSFKDCVLVDDKTAAEQGEFFLLTCQNTNSASGTARLFVNPERIYAILKIKMGGKNMTFSQRIRGFRIGEC